MGEGPDGVALWDHEAVTFDEAPDHGPADPAVRRAWSALLTGVLPAPRFVVADAGAPPLPRNTYDVVLSRHVLWAMTDAACWGRETGDERSLVLSGA